MEIINLGLTNNLLWNHLIYKDGLILKKKKKKWKKWNYKSLI